MPTSRQNKTACPLWNVKFQLECQAENRRERIRAYEKADSTFCSFLFSDLHIQFLYSPPDAGRSFCLYLFCGRRGYECGAFKRADRADENLLRHG